jgi:hypothetical protein
VRFKIKNVEDLENDSKFFAVNIEFSWKKLKEYHTLLNKLPVYLAALALYSQYKVIGSRGGIDYWCRESLES